MKHPMKIAGDLQSYGFWFTYWDLRNNWGCTRGQTLWSIWISWNVSRHLDKLHNECGGFIDSEVAK